MLLSRPMPASFMITQVLSSFLNPEDFVSFYQNESLRGTRRINLILSYYKLKFLWGSTSVCPYRCTFADPRQMEYMCSSVYSVCFPLWNGLDRTFPVRESTVGHGAELSPEYKPLSQLEVLLLFFHLEQAVRSRCNTSFPEKEVSGISSVSLWTQ